ncbi:50S ribosomal protein L30 [Acidocella sp.]|jgi:large subunit ribosomal protein L30|uniref:50S ribosomal protein L30 n=1 Tax=Acidocella sp. TaxID=50710 RepID=UPI00261FC24C|nr:50S ribosomal protein L30 [Acidocella sp.]
MSDKKIRITQVASGFGRKPGQKENLVGLGLNKIGRSVEVVATPDVLGKVNKVKHLLKVEELG